MQYYAHRLAWFYVHGGWPTYYIDHINRRKSDNRIANLREVKPFENSQNTKAVAKGVSGRRGVKWFAPTRCWAAAYQTAVLLLHTHRPDPD